MKRYFALLALSLLPVLVSCEPSKEKAKIAPSPAPIVESTITKVRLNTNQGDIVLELDTEKAPITVENFLGYVKSKHYDGTIFHRVMDGFMIQGGGFAMVDGKPAEKPSGSPIKNEGRNGLSNKTGTIAMARTDVLDSATTQFFINVSDNTMLDFPNNGGYAVFGKVIEGMDVVGKIKAMETRVAPGSREKSTPLEPVMIVSATIMK